MSMEVYERTNGKGKGRDGGDELWKGKGKGKLERRGEEGIAFLAGGTTCACQRTEWKRPYC